MRAEEDLILALEFLAEGENSIIPDELSRNEFASESFRPEIEGFRSEKEHWVAGAGIQALGVGEKISNEQPTGELAVRVYVEKKEMDLDSIENPVEPEVTVPYVGSVRTDVIEIGQLETEQYTAQFRPASPGLSIGHNAMTTSGTFGLLVRLNEDDGKQYILSNSHVIARSGLGQTGDPVWQPGPGDGGTPNDTIASLAAWVPFDFTPAGSPNLVDAAIAKAIDSVTDMIRLIGRPTGVSNQIQRGMLVQKVGRSTNHTWGEVTDVNAKMPLRHNMPGGGSGLVYFRDQVICTRYTFPGDSGSAVLNDANEVVGLHAAGSYTASVFNKIEHVFSLLDLRLA